MTNVTRFIKLRTLALAAAGAAAVSMCGLSPVAAAAGPAIQGGPASVRGGWSLDDPYDWYHPEWGPGWNNGYPAPGWVPPQGWRPPNDWVPPQGWAPPPGYAPTQSWVGPCTGPLADLLHPVRCARF